jgi:hypothetical protein
MDLEFDRGAHKKPDMPAFGSKFLRPLFLNHWGFKRTIPLKQNGFLRALNWASSISVCKQWRRACQL